MIASVKEQKEQPKSQQIEALSLAWWLQFEASNPTCIYFCGPFESQQEADASIDLYLENFKQEHEQIVNVSSRFCQPRQSLITECELTFADLANSSLPFFRCLIKH
ncbi:MAG: DUF1816 domain-containing protein [Cyanobacteria bacterium J06639_16]